MKASISDKTYLSDLTGAEIASIKKSLTYQNPKYLEALKQSRSVRGIPKTIELFQGTDDGLSIPRGISLALLGVVAGDVMDDHHSHPVEITSIIEPRTYQERALREMVSAGGGVLVAPTGSGKTTIGIELASRLGERCLILVKSKDLAEQWIGAIKKFTGLDAGLIGGGKWKESEQFTVALVQTLFKHDGPLDYGLVIVDECHNVPARQAFAVINRQRAKYRFGLSATPQRRDDLEMMIHAALGPLVAEIESSEVSGAVLPVTVPTLQYNFQGNPKSWVDFINKLAEDPERNRLIVNSAIKSSRSIGTAVLTGTVEHAEKLHQRIKQHGIDALLLHGKLPKKLREERMHGAPDCQLIIGTLSLLSEGIDWPHVGAVIFASPVSAAVNKETPAATRLIQSIGRARRPFPGKLVAHVMDIIDANRIVYSVRQRGMPPSMLWNPVRQYWDYIFRDKSQMGLSAKHLPDGCAFSSRPPSIFNPITGKAVFFDNFKGNLAMDNQLVVLRDGYIVIASSQSGGVGGGLIIAKASCQGLENVMEQSPTMPAVFYKPAPPTPPVPTPALTRQPSFWQQLAEGLREIPLLTWGAAGVIVMLEILRRRLKAARAGYASAGTTAPWWLSAHRSRHKSRWRLVFWSIVAILVLPHIAGLINFKLQRQWESWFVGDSQALLDPDTGLIKDMDHLMVYDNEQPENPAIPCSFVGVWSSRNGKEIWHITMRADGTYEVGNSQNLRSRGQAKGHWMVQRGHVVWLAPGYQPDINRIKSHKAERFSLYERNSSVTQFERIAALPAENCQVLPDTTD
ncbi:MAG: DEAD/DEAH box helicase [Methylococcaceae bacterium]|nr:DEAD/DEAH box helicase [Methylococcaceae bacterium]